MDSRSALLVTSYPGQESAAELHRLAVAGQRPRKDYVELARLLNADVIDSDYIEARGTAAARSIARRIGLPAGQIADAFMRRRQYQHICVWSDRLGLSLALLHKLFRSRSDIALISAWPARGRKALLLQQLRVHSHIGVMINDSVLQMEIAAKRLGVPRSKLTVAPQPVDDRFWHPYDTASGNLLCSVGLESRDYSTLLQAVRGVDIEANLVVGSVVLSGDPAGPVGEMTREVAAEGLPPNVRLLNKLPWTDLRDLYSRSRFVVIPMHDAEYNAGVTALAEAMAMGKAVIVTQTRGLAGSIRDGEHGLFVPPGDPTALRSAIEFLSSHPEEAERMGRAGRALVEERHAMDICIPRLAELVRSSTSSTVGASRSERLGAVPAQWSGNRPGVKR